MEMILALGVGSVILAAVANALIVSQQVNLRSYQNQQAELYLQEANEAVRSLWLLDWDNIKTSGIYHPEVSVGDWNLAAGEEGIDIYTRKTIIFPVFIIQISLFRIHSK